MIRHSALIGLLLFVNSTSVRAALTVNIGANFNGTTIGQSGFIPPDTMGAVGTNHVVEMINGAFAVYN